MEVRRILVKKYNWDIIVVLCSIHGGTNNIEKRQVPVETCRFSWSEWGDSNSRHLEPKERSKLIPSMFVISGRVFSNLTYF